MSKPLPKQTAKKPAEKGPKPKVTGESAAAEAPVPEQAALAEGLGRQGQLASLPNHSTASGLRRAAVLGLQRRHGNSHVQRWLGRQSLAPANGANGSQAGLQRQVGGQGEQEDDQPTEAQKAAARSAAQAAEGSASQAVAQGQQEASSSREAGSQAKQSAQQASQQAAESQSAPGAAPGSAQATQSPAGLNGAGPGPAPGGPNGAGPASATAEGEMAGPGGGGGGEKAPSSPEEDSAFLAIIEQIKKKSGEQKKHPPAGTKAQEAQQAAESPPAETASKAQAAQVGEMQAAEEPAFDAAGLKAQLLQKIQALAPKTAKEADEFKSSGKLNSLKSEVQGKMAQEKAKSAEPMKQKTQAAPNTAGIPPKPVSPLKPAEFKAGSATVDAAKAVPKQKSQAEVEAPIKQESKSIDEQMQAAEITEEQLANSNEPEFQGALDSKKEAQQHAQEGPKNYREQESQQIGQAKGEANAETKAEMEGMETLHQEMQGQVSEEQVQTKSADEKKRKEVADKINGIYQKTKTKVEAILGTLDTKVDAIFDAGAAAAKVAFENYVSAKMEAYKQKRYGGWLGWARWAKDKLLGMPGEVNAFYAQGRQLYLSKMDAVLDNVVAIITSTLKQAKAEVASGKQEIQDYVNQLPAELQQVGQEAAAQIDSKFDTLESSIDEKQNQLVDRLAQKYNDNLQAVDARIEELKAANKGLVQKALDAVKGVIQTIMKLKDMLLGVLSKAASAVSKIIKNPISFLSNLIGGIKSGLQGFLTNIGKHLKKGLLKWLFGALSKAGIQLPESFDMKGILSLVMQVLGLTWETIRARAVKAFGERAVGVLEKVFDVFQVIKSEGIGGLFNFIKDKISGIKDLVLDSIREMVITQVIKAGIQWLMGILGGPAGAFIKAAKAIYDIVMWFINNASQIAALVNSIVDSIGAIASGAVGQAAKFIENSLAKAIPVVIGFLANLLGLGGIADKVKGVIEKVRAPVTSAIDWILGKAKSIVRRLGGLVGGKAGGKEAGKAAKGDKKKQEPGPDKRSSQQKQKDLDKAVQESVKAMKAPDATPEKVRQKLPAIKSKYKMKKLELVPGDKNTHLVKAEINPTQQSQPVQLPGSTEVVKPPSRKVKMSTEEQAKLLARYEKLANQKMGAVVLDTLSNQSKTQKRKDLQALYDRFEALRATVSGRDLTDDEAKQAKEILAEARKLARSDFSNVQRAIWRRLRKDPELKKIAKDLASSGAAKVGGRSGSVRVYTEWLDGRKGFQPLEIEHKIRLSDNPWKYNDPGNLIVTDSPQNQQYLEALRRVGGIWPSDEVERFVTRHREKLA